MTFLNPLDLMQDRPESTSEDVHYGKVLDPKQNKDPKKLGRVRTRVPELDGEAGSGIPDDHLPLSQLERHENFGTQSEMSHFQMPQKDAHVKMRFHGSDPYSSLGSGAPYSQPGAISEVDSEDQYKLYHQKDPLANIGNHTDMGKKNVHSDHTQMDGPHNHRTRGVTTFYFTNSKSNTPGANKFDQGGEGGGGQQLRAMLYGADGLPLKMLSKSGDGRLHEVTRNHLGMTGPARDIGGFQAGDQGEGKAKVNYFCDEEHTSAVVKPKQDQQQQQLAMGLLQGLFGADGGGEKPHEADDKDLKKLTFTKKEKEKITMQVNDEQGEKAQTQIIMEREKITIQVMDQQGEQPKSSIILTRDDIKLKSDKIVAEGKNEVTLKSDTKIVTDGNTFLGSSDASKPVSAQGTIDSRGDSDTGNFLSKVKGT